MTGPFAQTAEDFIQYKRSCGFKYENEPKCLSRFCRLSFGFSIVEDYGYRKSVISGFVM